uniref:Uncharacterized protein n=1 Tax=Utricularia reniformis TaxID=192314 RepID=A0A1Y0B4J6_9LAMI|nr:hypothetical protein AEK19_MT2165 [Utricularia reniformis]ART32313.1 hypothetical protein AEK19_MT2165 [Utricularia reniformis]
MTRYCYVQFGGQLSTDPYFSLVAWAVTLFDYGVVLLDLNAGILHLFAIVSFKEKLPVNKAIVLLLPIGNANTTPLIERRTLTLFI